MFLLPISFSLQINQADRYSAWWSSSCCFWCWRWSWRPPVPGVSGWRAKKKKKTPAVCEAVFVKRVFLFYFRGSLVMESTFILRVASLLEWRHCSVFLVLSCAYPLKSCILWLLQSSYIYPDFGYRQTFVPEWTWTREHSWHSVNFWL